MAILIVEDNPVSSKMMEAFLNTRGYHTYWAENGKAALAHLQARHRKIEIILLDIMMPEMDGFEFLKIKQDNSQWKNIPVIVCSAFSNMEMVSKAIAMGCKYYVVKPVNVSQLFQKIQKVTGLKPSVKSENTSNDEMDIYLYKDIVLTFSAMVRKKITQLHDFLQYGFNEKKDIDFSDISEASCCFGAKWLRPVLDQLSGIYDRVRWGELTSETKQQLKMQINILEKILPTDDLNHIPPSNTMHDFWNHVKNKNSDTQIDISVLQQGYQIENMFYMRIIFIEENMITYDPIVNINGDILCESAVYLTAEHIAYLLKLAQHEIIVEPFRVVNTNYIHEITINKDEEVTTAKVNKPEYEALLIDFDKALENVDGNADLLKELLMAFVDEIPNYLDKMTDCLAMRDAKKLELLAHKFKTNFHHFGAESLFHHIKEIEEYARMNDLSAARQQFIRLEQSVIQFKDIVCSSSG